MYHKSMIHLFTTWKLVMQTCVPRVMKCAPLSQIYILPSLSQSSELISQGITVFVVGPFIYHFIMISCDIMNLLSWHGLESKTGLNVCHRMRGGGGGGGVSMVNTMDIRIRLPGCIQGANLSPALPQMSVTNLRAVMNYNHTDGLDVNYCRLG